MGTFAAPNGAESARIGAEQAPVQGELPVDYDRTTPQGSYAYAQALARRTVMATQLDCRTVDGAIHIISRRYKLRSFVRKLWKGERVSIHDHLLKRLERAHLDAVRSVQTRF